MTKISTAKILNHNVPEVLFFVVVWIFVLLVPLFQEAYDSASGFTDAFDWSSLGQDYLALVPFLVIFLVDKLIFEPKFFFRGRVKTFFVTAFLTALIVSLAFSFVAPEKRQRHRRFEPKIEMVDHNRPFVQHHGPRLDPKPEPAPDMLDMPVMPVTLRLLRGPFLPMFIMSLMMVVGSLGMAIIFHNRRDQIDYKEREAEHLKSELDYLKYQINPHFFMNTLNNIHALVDIDSELAKEAIIGLSRMMRYLLYESNQPTVPMKKELAFVQQYLDLMKLRCDEFVTVTYQEPDDGCKSLEAGVPPLMLISFIENAFKHGISHKEHSFIDICISHEDDRFHFHCCNSNFANDSNAQQQGGVGLDNVRKRLELIYPGSYTLNIVPTDKEFTVDLWLPVSHSEALNTKNSKS